MQFWALTFVAKHAAPNIVVLFTGTSTCANLKLSSPAPASYSPAAQPTGISPSARPWGSPPRGDIGEHAFCSDHKRKRKRSHVQPFTSLFLNLVRTNLTLLRLPILSSFHDVDCKTTNVLPASAVQSMFDEDRPNHARRR